ncbi:MAG: citrate/2-methylcitrate synthase [Kiritimatiellia bacterium]
MDKHHKYLKELCDLTSSHSQIPQELYHRFNVKRGLRNTDGTGVLVGLTNIGEVHGYTIDESEKVPDTGKLYYRGYSVEDLIQGLQQSGGRFGFEEATYLLLFGELPSAAQLEDFCKLMGEYRELPSNFTVDMILKIPSRNIMNKLARSVLVLYSYDDLAEDISAPNVLRQCLQLIAAFPVLSAYGYQAIRRYFENKSLFLHNPDPKLSTAENFLRLTRVDGNFTPLEAELLDQLLIVHAEHGGGNNSAFTMHVVTSSATDTYSAFAAAVGSLKGPRHGGASLQVKSMMDDLMKTCGSSPNETKITSYIDALLDRKAFDESGLIYGMGHAVYTQSDPRAVILREKARQLAEEKNMLDQFEVYAAIERLAPDIFHRKKGITQPLCANVDLYSGFVYSMLGIPEYLYTPIFAIARMAGWSAHRLEQLITGGKIIRPAYKGTSKRRGYIQMADRV